LAADISCEKREKKKGDKKIKIKKANKRTFHLLGLLLGGSRIPQEDRCDQEQADDAGPVPRNQGDDKGERTKSKWQVLQSLQDGIRHGVVDMVLVLGERRQNASKRSTIEKAHRRPQNGLHAKKNKKKWKHRDRIREKVKKKKKEKKTLKPQKMKGK
jgi:hypothetical protein